MRRLPRRLLKRFLVLLGAFLTSCALVFSLTVAELFLSGKLFRERKFVKTEISVAKIDKTEAPKQKERVARKPNRRKAASRSPKSGPQLAMNLGVAGRGGAAISEELGSDFRGGAQSAGNGDVDRKPESRALPNFQVPPQIRDRETDAVLRLGFCVGADGRVFDVRVLEERPASSGLAEAGRDALSRMVFEPAEKEGKPVPFCGMEQPFEVRFHD